MNELKTELLIIGIGNAGRQDDGLGWGFLDSIQRKVHDCVRLVYRYQLNIEDAELITSAAKVLFVDARKSTNNQPFEFSICKPKESFEFTTHALGPEVILSLCQNLYQSFPDAYLLTISGYEWELEEGLSKKAQCNLKEALIYFENEKTLSCTKSEVLNSLLNNASTKA